MGVEVKLDTAGLDALLASWDAGAQHLLDSVAHDILTDAQGRAPVRTGYLRSTGHIEPGDDRNSRYIVFDAPYAIFVEFGTRHMHPQAFLLPAVEHHRSGFEQHIRELFGSFVEH